MQSPSQSHADQVKAIQDDPRVKAAFDHIDKDRDEILREWIAITEINAPSKQEQERAKFIESLLRKHKLEIRYDSAGNLIATRKGTGGGPVTVFDAHMDTVFQPGLKIKATVRDGRVYAPGVGDDTRNIEALLATIRALDAAKIKTKGDLVFLFTTDEEAGMTGAKQYTKDNKGKVITTSRSTAVTKDSPTPASASTGIAITSLDQAVTRVRALRLIRQRCRWHELLHASTS